jgi:hypothetical protein
MAGPDSSSSLRAPVEGPEIFCLPFDGLSYAVPKGRGLIEIRFLPRSQGVKELKSLTFQLFDFRSPHPEILFFPASQLAIVLLKYE